MFVCLFSFCFSMTVGVVWEFFEFGADMLFEKDMQKDTVITAYTFGFDFGQAECDNAHQRYNINRCER